uniref:Uncharacterized protein n=1 Tax=Vannella robusta TaxID=1487602 RepID=A0A7S4HKH3_9EUKA|mmetsp:Transcript_11983/g.14970  ORF Transcript_11983/g.14970 Transcript_11983/m.14970 type:complete len:155 (+) Transcript_11983:374-838(+)
MLRGLRQDFRIRRVLHENNINRESVMGTQVVKDLLIDFGAEEGEEPSVDLLAAHRFLKALFSALHVKLSDKDITFVIERCKSKSAADQEIFSLDDFLAFLKFSLPQSSLTDSLNKKQTVADEFDFPTVIACAKEKSFILSNEGDVWEFGGCRHP